MSAEDRSRWDAIYRQHNQGAFPEPDPFLFEYVPPAAGPGEQRALDLAGGMGQNGLWLASQGYVVDVMDISRLALVRGRAEMVRRSLRNINFLLCDLEETDLKQSKYQVVCVFRYLQRDLMPRIRASIKPGGRIVYETFNTNYLNAKPHFNSEYLLIPGELAGYFADWKILHFSETGHISRLAAIKPQG
ncbi:MAG TPA: methyltransferase domain-containing protein [Spirillospora sp.]|nr:methyltransferase domain-containing protein [Spirillospora sp.]